ncbi:hypothetical protein QR680_012368 [Steinernema hermaphroditum]|uniref:protein phosphatase methylesterase-1 n=1 Tax=Steinernema hermaphroditum TaxID=289476 RepID=A0AA39M0N1_9BILA|nr:hypothetical protein QR680_012368 [Steinernema hermaphroditum]
MGRFFTKKDTMNADLSTNLSFKEARQLMKEYSSLIAVKEKRHFVLNWSATGDQYDVIWKIVEKSIGNYNRRVRGIPIAIGKIQIDSKIFIVEEGRKIHIDAVIPQIIFRPKKGEAYRCEVTSSDKKFYNGFLFNKIAVGLVPKNENTHPDKAGQAKFYFTNIQMVDEKAHAVEHSPIGWEEFFTAKVLVETENGDRFNVYRKGDKGPVFYLLHGGGYTGLTWCCFVEELTKQVECQVVAPDLRGHGETKTTDDYNLSVDQQLQDIKNIYDSIFPQKDNFPHCILIGHSMGGALAVHASERELIPNTFALAVIDVVEGTAVAALKQMRTVLMHRPKQFPDESSAIDWACRTGACRNLRQARVSMPSQLRKIQSGETKRNHLGLTWKIDLALTEPHWPTWFEGLSQKFLKCKPTKMLILAHVDRLDKDLTVAQMQGKFHQVVLPNCGHAVHEDAPHEVANLFVSLLNRYKVILQKSRPNKA